jgi:hypothetical protein
MAIPRTTNLVRVHRRRATPLLGFFVIAFAALVTTALAPAFAQSPASLVTGDWRSSDLVVLQSHPPLAPQAAIDFGPAAADLRLDRMILVLAPSAAQHEALTRELDDQQDPASPKFHRFLTPAAFADAYSNSLKDVEAIEDWLRSQGFDVAPLPSGRAWIEFSGSVAQVELAFHTQIHLASAPSGTRAVLAASIAVPAPFAPLIDGLASLDAAVASPALTAPQPVRTSPDELASETSPTRAEALSPQIIARALHLDSLHASGIDGAGQSIAIPSRSNVRAGDVAAFRAAFVLPTNPLDVELAGADPGLNGDEAEAVLAASWAGAAAPAARILIVPAATTSATDGLDLALAAIVDRALTGTVSIGHGICEPALSEAHRDFYAALFRQAAAQGISVISAAGDSGAAACHAAGTDAPVHTGYAVNALASTPWNTAAGVAAFANDSDAEDSHATLSAWSPVDPAGAAYASGGGASAFYTLPGWQARATAQLDQTISIRQPSRILPDLALPTAVDTGINHGLAFCMSGDNSNTACNLFRSGGSAASSAIFAGIAALIAQRYGPQGNLAPNLYALAAQPGIYHDVEFGSAQLACEPATPGCDADRRIGYAAAPGFDLATGLGSIDAQALVTRWLTPAATGKGLAIVVMTTVTQTINPSGSIDLAAQVTSGDGGPVPTGTLTFIDESNKNATLGTATINSTGVASKTVTGVLTIGGHNIAAKYDGNSNYAPEESLPVTINVAKSTTTLVITPSTTSPLSGASLKVTASITSPSPGATPPSGIVTFTLDGIVQGTHPVVEGSPSTSTINITLPASGSHNLQATYSGDNNYDESTSSVVVINIVSKGETVTTLTASPATLTAGTPETFTATVAPSSPPTGSYTITGFVTFFDGSTLLGNPVPVNPVKGVFTATLKGVTLSPSISHTITALYSGDSNWATSTSSPLILKPLGLADSVTLAASVNTVTSGQTVTFIATVTPAIPPGSDVEAFPTGDVIFLDGTTVLASASLAPSTGYAATATYATGALPSGKNVITAHYVGDTYYSAGTSSPVTLDVQDFTITPDTSNPPGNLTIVQGSSGSATFDLAGLGGFNNQVQVVCAVPGGLDMTCTANPQIITPPGKVKITVTTYGSGTASARNRPAPLWPGAAGGAALAFLGFFLLPLKRRACIFTQRCAARMLPALIFLAALACFVSGCSSSVTPVSSGTPLGVATLKITAADNVPNTVVSHSVYLNVNVIAPGS